MAAEKDSLLYSLVDDQIAIDFENVAENTLKNSGSNPSKSERHRSEKRSIVSEKSHTKKLNAKISSFSRSIFHLSMVLCVTAGVIFACTIYIVLSSHRSDKTDSIKVPYPNTFYAYYESSGYSTNDLVKGPTWTSNSGSGIIAQNYTSRQVYSENSNGAVLLSDNVVYVSLDGIGCAKYEAGYVHPTSLLADSDSFLFQYFCQWIFPSPCSWESVENFYNNGRYTTTVLIGNNRTAVDVYWMEYLITVNSYNYYKTVELDYDGNTGVLVHMSQWTSDQNQYPFYKNDSLFHSDDNILNITTNTLPEDVFTPRQNWTVDCISIPPPPERI